MSNEAARASYARLSDLSKPLHDPHDLLAQAVLLGLREGGDTVVEVEAAHLEEIGLGLRTEAYALWLRQHGLRQRRNPRKWVMFRLQDAWGGPLDQPEKGAA